MSERQHLETLAAEIFQLIGEENYSQLDSILANVCPAEQTEVEMLALLRYSFSARHHLVNYHIYLDQVAQEMLSRGKDVEMLLRGLPFYSIDRYP